MVDLYFMYSHFSLFEKSLDRGGRYLVVWDFLLGLPLELVHLWLGIASGLGLLFSMATKKKRIPFGPWLFLVGWLLLIIGEQC